MRKHIYEFLYLTRQERNGLLIIMLATALISFLPKIYSAFLEKENTDFSFFIKEIESFHQAEELTKPFAFSNPKIKKSESTKPIRLFNFDPNNASKEDFIQLGLSSKTAQTIINFRNKGAKFFKKEDLKKVYGLKESDYQRLENYIQIEKEKSTSPIFAKNEIPKSYDTPTIQPIAFDPNKADEKTFLQNGIPQHVVNTIFKYRDRGGVFQTKGDLKKIYTLKEDIYNKIEPYIEIAPIEKRIIVKASAQKEDTPKSSSKPTNTIIDINQSSPEEWQQLNGIGPSFSKRIVKFRDKLGGFSSVNQVRETYGLPDSTFQKIKPQLQSSPILNKINLNEATEDQLKAHPYISWNQAKLIISYRNMHGKFQSVNELLKIGALKKEWIEKIQIYLKL